ncbi:MAG: ABC transporter ATP-binding protein [Pseudomonadota bacterium]
MIVAANNLQKRFGDTAALDGFTMSVPAGRVVGLIGPNGSGKTTALKSILGLATLDGGELQVMGKDPLRQRAALMQDVVFIADTGILPKWMRVGDLLDYVDAVQPGFNRAAAVERLAKTEIRVTKRVRTLSKGMHVQLHLAIVLATEAKLLVLDEPTLGLDILYRQQFYDAILNDYYEQDRSILVTTHEVREIEHILTDVVFIHKGRTLLSAPMEDLAQRYTKLVTPDEVSLPTPPISTKRGLSGYEYVVQDVPRNELAELGSVTTPNLAELFVAVVGE